MVNFGSLTAFAGQSSPPAPSGFSDVFRLTSRTPSTARRRAISRATLACVPVQPTNSKVGLGAALAVVDGDAPVAPELPSRDVSQTSAGSTRLSSCRLWAQSKRVVDSEVTVETRASASAANAS